DFAASRHQTEPKRVVVQTLHNRRVRRHHQTNFARRHQRPFSSCNGSWTPKQDLTVGQDQLARDTWPPEPLCQHERLVANVRVLEVCPKPGPARGLWIAGDDLIATIKADRVPLVAPRD